MDANSRMNFIAGDADSEPQSEEGEQRKEKCAEKNEQGPEANLAKSSALIELKKPMTREMMASRGTRRTEMCRTPFNTPKSHCSSQTSA